MCLFRKDELPSVMLARACLISLLTLFFSDLSMVFYVDISGMAVPNWGIVGRWFDMIFSGQFYTPSIADMPPVKDEKAIGLLAHMVVAFIFTLFYTRLFSLNNSMKRLFFGGIVLAWALSVIPLLFELPSMGAGILGFNTPQPGLTFLRVMVTRLWPLSRSRKTI
jgi:hypothetical protein